MMNNKIIKSRRLPLIAILAFSVLVYVLYGEYFSLTFIQEQRESFLSYKQAYPALTAFLFLAMYSVSTGLSLPFGTILAVLGGFLFGIWWGLLIVTFGATIGATAIFLVSKYSLQGAVPKRYKKPYDKVKKKFEENEVSYLFFLRLVPLFPFALVNILPALFNVPTRTYIYTTFFGIIPGTFAHTYLGSALSEITSLKGLISPQVIGAIALLGVLSLLPIAIKLYKNHKKAKLNT